MSSFRKLLLMLFAVALFSALCACDPSVSPQSDGDERPPDVIVEN